MNAGLILAVALMGLECNTHRRSHQLMTGWPREGDTHDGLVPVFLNGKPAGFHRRLKAL